MSISCLCSSRIQGCLMASWGERTFGVGDDRKTIRLFISMDFLNHGMLLVGTNQYKFSVYYAVFSVNYSENWCCDSEATVVTMHLQLIVNYVTTKVHIVVMSKLCHIKGNFQWTKFFADHVFCRVSTSEFATPLTCSTKKQWQEAANGLFNTMHIKEAGNVSLNKEESGRANRQFLCQLRARCSVWSSLQERPHWPHQ